MRTLVVSEFMTLDGVMEAPGGEPSHPHTDWVSSYAVPELFEYKFQEILEAESLLLGRTTWESFEGAWPQREGEFADKMNTMAKHVVTSTRADLGWNSTVLTGDVPTAVAELKAGDGGPIMVNGSATLVHALLREGLVDELRLQVFPLSIGGGLRVFPDDRTKTSLQLIELEQYSNGVTRHTYRL